jgi:uncharacterized protein YhaN
MSLRIERLDFSPWGCFEDHSLKFAGKAGHVELIYGPNASGKSTTSRGERSLLYGIDARSADGHTHAYQDLRIGARLELDGIPVELSRRKRRAGSLTDADGNPLAEDTIANALGGLSADIYRGLFQVDHDTLVKGGAELAQGKGEIGATLFAAAAGVATLHDTLSALEGDAERLFSPRARTTVLHRTLATLRDAEKRTREATLRPTRHRELTKILGDTQQACETFAQEIRQIDYQTRALERQRALAPLLDTHATLREELTGLDGTPELPDSAAAERAGAQGRISAGNLVLGRVRETCERLAREIAAVEVDEALLTHAEEVGLCKERVAAISKARGDRRKREGELQEITAALISAAGVIGLSDPDDIASLRRPASAHRALDTHLTAHGELTSRHSAAQARVKDAERNLRSARAELNEAPAVVDAKTLESALTSAMRAGALGEQIEQAALQTGRCEREAEQSERAVEEKRALAAEGAECVKEAQRLADAEHDLGEAQDALRLAGLAPSAEQLARAREQREEHWGHVRAYALSASKLGVQDADTFERAISDADGLADSRTEHATQIERSAELEARAQRLMREKEDLTGREQKIQRRGDAIKAAWEKLWIKTGLEAIQAADAASWLAEREQILALEHERGDHEARAKMLALRERAERDALAAELSVLHERVAASATLGSLIERAQTLLARWREDASIRSGLQATVRAGELALAATEEERASAEDEMASWRELWPTRRTEGGLPETATPAAAQEILRAIEDGLGLLTRKQDLERRIAGIDNDREEFERDVTALCLELAPELSRVEPERAAAALHAKLAASERSQERRESLIGQQSEATEQLRDSEADLLAAERELALLLTAAGAETVEELPSLEERSARARALRVEIAALEQQIETVGGGRFAALVTELDSFDRDDAALQLAELQERSEEIRHDRDDAKELLGNRKRELADLESDTTAVQGAQEVALARAGVRDAAIAHAKARLASTVVRRAIERYRGLHQDPLLTSANQLFTRFTLGSCVELFVDVDDRGRGVLMSRERDRSLKTIEELSTGTCEQLFLALRIAAIERYVTSVGAVPVIFDDVFIESDEPRSERIFEALGELAGKTQVIVLTHHLHMIDVGNRALGEKLVVQRLPDAAPTLREVLAA